MTALFKKPAAYRSPAFLAYAKQRATLCCLCMAGGPSVAIELHHFGQKGMAQKGSDLLVARLCKACHERVQGKRRLAWFRDGDLEPLVRMLEDCNALLEGYIQSLEAVPPEQDWRRKERF